MKLQTEVYVPEGFDALHALNAVSDALRISDNVTEQEVLLAEHFFSKVKEALDAAKPKMKKFNVIYYGVIEANDDALAASVAVAACPSNKNFAGTEANYKHVWHEVKACK
jgi:hypothetical protein